MSNSSNWDEWKENLGKAVEFGENIGLSNNSINNIAEKVGSFLANHVEPTNEEERLLKELWDIGNQHDKHVLAKLVVKMTKK